MSEKMKETKYFDLPTWQDPESMKNIDRRVVTLTESASLASEQYRILRTRILSAGSTKRVFLISSAVEGEGKTLTSANLAVSIARGLHENVLLIEADLRKPNLSHLLGISNKTPGLAEYLRNGGDLANYLTKTSIPKISIITSGHPPENPSELIGSKRMAELISEVKARYDDRYVIIDSPPLIPVTDATILAGQADGIILVVKTLGTPREMVDEAIAKIGDDDKIIGLVINGCPKVEYGARYKYKYIYGKPYSYSHS